MSGDLDHLTQLLHDRRVRRFLCDDTQLPRETIAEMLARSAKLDFQGLGLWVIEDDQGAFAGIAVLEPVSAELAIAPQMAGGVEPVVAVLPIYWGQGFAQAALRALIGHARDGLHFKRLVGAVDQPNDRSHRMMLRCGFKVMGEAPGPAHPLILYELNLGDAKSIAFMSA